MGRKAPMGKGKVIASGNKPMASDNNVKSQGGIPKSGRIDRGGSNHGKGTPATGPTIVRKDNANY